MNARIAVFGAVLLLAFGAVPGVASAEQTAKELALPAPAVDGERSLEWALSARRSRRRFADTPLSRQELGQLLWAAQGITNSKRGYRTAPSAGARYPLRLYVLTAEGLFRYRPRDHLLLRLAEDDRRSALWSHVYAQESVRTAPAVFVFAVDYRRTEAKYGKRARRYVHVEVGHAGQNLLLQATTLGLHCVGVGAFHDRRVKKELRLPGDEEVLYLVPVGRPGS